MTETVHPAFDGKVWFIRNVSAPSLAILQRKLGPGYKIEGYYPNGYSAPFFQRPAADGDRTLVQNMAKKLPPSHKMPKPKGPFQRGGRPEKYDRDAILNMWVKGHTGPEIAFALGIKNWKRIAGIVSKEREKGDRRAVVRTSNRNWARKRIEHE